MFVENKNLRVVPLYKEVVAIVHPSTGAFVFMEDTNRITSLYNRLKVLAQPDHHLTIAESDPDHADIWAATESYRSEAELQEKKCLDTVILKVTNRCNEACKHCYDARGFDTADMVSEKLCAIIDEALALSGQHLNLLFHGGEPLLRSDILDEVAGYARAAAEKCGKSIGCFAQTNGSVLNKRIISVLTRHEFGLGISLDGWESLHDKLRIMSDGSGTYRLFKRSYNRYRDYMVQNSGILTTVMASNVDVLEKVVLHVRDLGFVTWDATLFDLNGKGAEFPHLAVDAERYCAALERIIDLIEANECRNIAIKPILRRLDNLLIPQKLDMCLPGNGPCGAGSRLLSISADGSLSGCDIIHDRSLMLGHSPKTTLAEATTKPEVDRMNRRLSHNLMGCHSCTWLGVCGGTCLARGGLNSVNTTDCMISKLINEVLLRRISRNDALLEWYALFPPQRRRASVIHETFEMFA
ncbi:MAG: radical SAM protein [Pseudomonadales bacterium]|nr:radical SAM protein [Pseudomonadales bacterium]